MKILIKIIKVSFLGTFLILYSFTLESEAQDNKQPCKSFKDKITLPSINKKLKNPVLRTEANILQGKKLYQKKIKMIPCAQCHGRIGNGKGPMAWAFNPSPTNFNCKEGIVEVSDGRLFWTVKNGSHGTGMLPYKNLADEEIWKIILYIRELKE